MLKMLEKVYKKIRWFVLTKIIDPYLRAKRGFGYTDLFDFDYYVLMIIYRALFKEGKIFKIQVEQFEMPKEYVDKMYLLKLYLEKYLADVDLAIEERNKAAELIKDLIGYWWT